MQLSKVPLDWLCIFSLPSEQNLQVDAEQLKLAKARVHQDAAQQAAKQQAKASKARQKRIKSLQTQQRAAR